MENLNDNILFLLWLVIPFSRSVSASLLQFMWTDENFIVSLQPETNNGDKNYMNLNKLTPIVNKPSAWALTPLVVFLCLYLVTSILVNDFYKVPITVAFMVSSIYAVAIPRD